MCIFSMAKVTNLYNHVQPISGNIVVKKMGGSSSELPHFKSRFESHFTKFERNN